MFGKAPMGPERTLKTRGRILYFWAPGCSDLDTSEVRFQGLSVDLICIVGCVCVHVLLRQIKTARVFARAPALYIYNDF